jgi:hypothetical protein
MKITVVGAVTIIVIAIAVALLVRSLSHRQDDLNQES